MPCTITCDENIYSDQHLNKRWGREILTDKFIMKQKTIVYTMFAYERYK